MPTFARFRQIAVFFAVGAFNTAAYFLLANGLYLVGIGQGSAAFVAYGILVPVSFFGHRRLTFGSRGRVFSEWIRFCAVQAANLLIIGAVTAGDLPGWVAFAIISVLIPISNFVVFQIWVFARRYSA